MEKTIWPQYSNKNTVEISGIPNSIPDDYFENTVVSICEESRVEIDPRDIEGCHRVPLSRNSRGQDKRRIVNFFQPKALGYLIERRKADK